MGKIYENSWTNISRNAEVKSNGNNFRGINISSLYPFFLNCNICNQNIFCEININLNIKMSTSKNYCSICFVGSIELRRPVRFVEN